MYNILIKLIVAASLLQSGITLTQGDQCSSRGCWNKIQQASHKIIKIDWKPVSIFPEQAKRFNQ